MTEKRFDIIENVGRDLSMTLEFTSGFCLTSVTLHELNWK